MSLYEAISDLALSVEEMDLSLRERETTSDFTRTTTVIRLEGDGAVGRGEDVTYDDEEHYSFVRFEPISVEGEYRFDEFSAMLGDADLFAEEPGREDFRHYRRWGFESAALDLALKQAGESLADVLGREYDPVRFIASTRLGEPPTIDRVEQLLERRPEMEFKLDPTSEWTPELVADLVGADCVKILDLKGQYEDTMVDQAPDPSLYELILTEFPDAIGEDPGVTAETRPILEDRTDRLSWDAPIRSVESIESLPWEPSWMNIKPSRFGSVRSVLAAIEYCLEKDISMYGGGQFELDVGRQHLQALASIFYPDGPNDIAPAGYNVPELPDELPASPLEPPADPVGFDWDSPDTAL